LLSQVAAPDNGELCQPYLEQGPAHELWADAPFELPILLARLQGLLRRHEWMREAAAQATTAAVLASNGSESVENEFGTFSFTGSTIDFGNLELRTSTTTTHLTVMSQNYCAT
jgi:DNA-binding response OmpR family regulator